MDKMQIEYDFLNIPFKENFSHASFTRNGSESLIVKVFDQYIIGIGESSPRIYVTRETKQTITSFFYEILPQLSKIRSVEELFLFIETNQTLIDKNPSAFCAVELALLDYFSKKSNLSIENLLQIDPPLRSSSGYTAVIGISTRFKFFKRLIQFKALGLNDLKLKISGNQEDDLYNLKISSKLYSSVRLDGNNIFKNKNQAFNYLEPLKEYFWAIEEPLSPYLYNDLIELGQKLNKKIIVDESFLKIQDIENFNGHFDLFIPNIRISKCGGYFRTLKLIKKLNELGIDWILGTHVGEMSMLTRSSFLILASIDFSPLKKEGGFSSHLLSYDPFFPNLKLRVGGKIKFHQKKFGFGLEFKHEKK